MPGIHDFDDFILGLGRPSEEPNGFSLAEAGLFLSAFRKLAADVEAQPSPLAPEYAAPPEDVVRTCLAIAAQLLHAHTAYTVYAAALRGPAHTALAEEFKSIAEADLEDVEYFLTRANVIADGAPLQLPPVPPPPALSDEAEMVQHIIEGAHRLIALMKTLHVQVGEHPMKYTVEAQIDGEQAHLDRLTKLLPARAPQTAPAKVAHLVSAVKRASAEAVISNEAAMALAQAQNEAAFLRNQAAQQQQQTAQVQQQLEATSMQAQQAQQQLQMVQQQADMQAQQAQQATQMATQAQTEAASHADAKMRLAMRIQQFRQQLADLVSQDPVAEEGAVPEAGTPQPQTAPQQQQNQAAAEQQAAEQQGAQVGPPASAKAAKEADQAQRAQQKAEEQTAQAQQVEQEDAAKGKVAGVIARLRGKTAGAVTVGLPKELIGDRLHKLGRFAKMHGMDRNVVKATNAEHAAFRPMSPLSQVRGRNPGGAPAANVRSSGGTTTRRISGPANPSSSVGANVQRPAPIPSTPAGSKRRATQAIDSLALGEHIKRERGVADAVRAGLPMRGDAATLEALSRGEGVGFGKGAALYLPESKTAGRVWDWTKSKLRAPFVGIGDAMAEGMVGNPQRLETFGKHVGHGAGTAGAEALDTVLKEGDVLKKVEHVMSKAGRIAKGTVIGAGVLGTGFLAHKGLQHYSKLKGQAQEQRRLDQQERLLAALERQGKAPRLPRRPQSTELPGAPERTMIQPKFSSNTDIGTMS